MNLKEEWQYNNITCPENGCRCDPIRNPKCDKANPRWVGTRGSYLEYTCDCKAKYYSWGNARINPNYEDNIVPWLIVGIILGVVVGMLLRNV